MDDKLITSMYGVFAIGDLDMTSAEAGRAGAAAVKSFLESDQFRSVANCGSRRNLSAERR